MRHPAKLPRRFDGRTNDARRVKHLIKEYETALGGATRLNVGEHNIVRRLAALIVLAERQEAQMISFDPKYNPDEHMRNVGKIKLLQDDFDLPKRSRSHSGNGDDDDYEDADPNAPQNLDEFLEREAKKPGFGKPISAASIGAAKRKRLRL